MTTTAVQTAVDNAPAIGVPGMLYDSSTAKDVVSVRATADIPFGSWVAIDEDGEGYLPALTGDVTDTDGGIALHSHEYATGGGYKQGDIMAVIKTGRVWVYAEETVEASSSPTVRFTANTTPTRPIGGILAGTDSGKAVARKGVTVYRGNAGAGLAVLQLNGNIR